MSGSHLVKGSLLTEERLCVHVASVSPLLGISAPVSRLPLGLRLGLVTPVDACLVLTCGSSPEPTLVIHLFIHSIILPHSRIQSPSSSLASLAGEKPEPPQSRSQVRRVPPGGESGWSGGTQGMLGIRSVPLAGGGPRGSHMDRARCSPRAGRTTPGRSGRWVTVSSGQPVPSQGRGRDGGSSSPAVDLSIQTLPREDLSGGGGRQDGKAGAPGT